MPHTIPFPFFQKNENTDVYKRQLLSSANHPVTGKELSSRLNVSDRTIRNYIREINEEKLIIQSSSNGYWITVLDSPCNKRKIESSLVYDFSSQNERLLYIAERIITSSEEADLYDIADDIYISYSTTVSYTHLDVYKRQSFSFAISERSGV